MIVLISAPLAKNLNPYIYKFLQSDGDILSDHKSITVNFTWSVSSTLSQSGFWGGPHGDWFNDWTPYHYLQRPQSYHLAEALVWIPSA